MAREQLQRVMRTPEVLFIGINGVVGGIFLLPGQVAQSAGAAAVWAYLAAGALDILIGLSYVDALATGHRRSQAGMPSGKWGVEFWG